MSENHSLIDPLVQAAARYADSYPTDLETAPQRRLAVLTCMDSRILPSRLLGVREGEAHIIRNAGGLLTEDTLRSLTMSQRLLGTRAIAVIQHTGCGMSGLDDDQFRDQVEADAGERPSWPVLEFGTDLSANVARTVNALRASVYLLHRDDIRGFVFDVSNGELSEVSLPGPGGQY